MGSEQVSTEDVRAERLMRREIQGPPKRLVYGLLGLLLLYVIVRGLVTAARMPFFFDEVTTLAVASQPGLRAIWGALARCADGQPPIFYWLERVATSSLGNTHIGLRLPSILAMPCTMACVFLYVRRRSGELVAFLSAVLLMLTSLFHLYVANARPYSQVMACVALALVCYQRLPSLRWATFLGLSLALAQALNYYAVFAMVPFGLAETVLFFRTRQFRWPVWIAFAFGVLPLLVCWPLLTNLRAYYGAHFWQHYSLVSLPKTYGAFFLTDAAFGAGIAAVSVAGVIGARLLAPRLISAEEAPGEGDPVEGTLLLALLALPVFAFGIIKLLHGAMLDRYVLSTIIGITLAIGCALSLAREKVVALFALFVFAAVGIHEISFWRTVHSLRVESPATPVEEFVEKGGHPELPVAVSDGLTYLQFAYYASPRSANRFVFLEDEQKAVQYLGTDSVDKNLVALRGLMPLHVNDFSKYMASHPVFLLYAEDPGAGFDWQPYYLSREAASMQTVAMEGSRRLYLVTMKGEASR